MLVIFQTIIEKTTITNTIISNLAKPPIPFLIDNKNITKVLINDTNANQIAFLSP
ncbi:MAG TPA: hypothetical protein P5052_00920 [Candidatus Paceibacterota bacterium]|nr:hypothetical protein [Candidatus Paceibacterota bacterium]HRZ29348.1 hypothetical protein [Candidatus Paceibacterota bacterium]